MSGSPDVACDLYIIEEWQTEKAWHKMNSTQRERAIVWSAGKCKTQFAHQSLLADISNAVPMPEGCQGRGGIGRPADRALLVVILLVGGSGDGSGALRSRPSCACRIMRQSG